MCDEHVLDILENGILSQNMNFSCFTDEKTEVPEAWCEIFFLLNLLKVHWALSIVFGQIESSVHKLLPQCKTTWGRQKYSESFAK